MESSRNVSENSKAYEKVIRYVKEQIIIGNIKQGQKLPPERELAEFLHVGRNSVREAIRTMSLMGIINSEHGSGNYVTCDLRKSLTESMQMLFLLGQVEYQQVAELRQALETQTIRLACERIRPEQLERLKEIMAQMRTESDEAKKDALDKEFHFVVSDASSNWLILNMQLALSDTIDEFMTNLRTHTLINEHESDIQNYHEDIIAALEGQDSKKAVQATLAHTGMIDYAIKSSMG